jgi:hypothetical protein
MHSLASSSPVLLAGRYAEVEAGTRVYHVQTPAWARGAVMQVGATPLSKN